MTDPRPVRTRRYFPACHPLEPRQLLSTTPGITYRYYQGTWSTMPNFATLQPVKSGITPGFDLSVRNNSADYGMLWEGDITIKKTGTYTFYSDSGDGSVLEIDGTKVVNNNGVHSMKLKSGSIKLTAGTHAIKLEYFQLDGRQDLTVSYSGPGIKTQVIPDSLFTTNASTVVDVSSYGAVGNGTTNDSTAIQNAIAATPDGGTLDFDAGKTYLLGSGLTIYKPINVEGNGAELLLDTSVNPKNETVYYSSPLDTTNYTWTQTVTQGQTTFNVAIPTSSIRAGDWIFLQVGTDPNDSTQPNFGSLEQVTVNTGTSITVSTPVPYNITQGTRSNSIQRITDLVQNVSLKDIDFNFVDGTTPDANLWLTMAKNVTVSNITGRFTIMGNIVDSQNVTVSNCNGTLDKLTSSGGRLITGWQDDNLTITNNTVTNPNDSPTVFLESWARNTTINGLTINSTYTGTVSHDQFHFTGNSYGTFATNITITNSAQVDLVETGGAAASYMFGNVTINGSVRAAPLYLIQKFTTGGATYDQSNMTVHRFNVPVKTNESAQQIALASGVVESITYELSDTTGVTSLYAAASNGGHALMNAIAANGTSTTGQLYGNDYPFDDPTAPTKSIYLTTNGSVPAGAILTVTVNTYD